LNGVRGSQPSRRLILEGGLAATAWLGAACSRRSFLRVDATVPAVGPVDAPPVALEVASRAGPSEVLLDRADGRPTRVWRLDGRRIQGAQEALVSHSDSYLEPTFRVRRGQRLRAFV
jgi:hypothetical protein